MPKRRIRRGGSRSRKVGRTRPKRNGRKGGMVGGGRVLRVGAVMAADRALYRLRYPILFQIAAGASTIRSVRYTWNSAIDLDPTVGSTSLPGYTAASTLYDFFRVIGANYKLTFTNRETGGVACLAKFTNTDPGTGATDAYVNSMAPHVRYCSLGPTAGDSTKTIRGKVNPALIYGERSAKVNPTFAGNNTGPTSPTALQYLGISVNKEDGVNFAAGVDVVGWIEVHVELFGLKKNISTFGIPTDWFDRELKRQHMNILNALSCFRKEYEAELPLVEDGEALFYEMCRRHTSPTCPAVPPLSLFTSALKGAETLSSESLEFAERIIRMRPEIISRIKTLSVSGLEMQKEILKDNTKILTRRLSMGKLDVDRYQSVMRGCTAQEVQILRPGVVPAAFAVATPSTTDANHVAKVTANQLLSYDQ